jgi:aminoglycoside phosphotransferase (APT) family kinase protein
MRMHPDELTVTVPVVRRLVAAQFPHWADLPVSRVSASGTVNAIFRVGERLAARFPLRADEPARVRAWLRVEADAARELRGRTPFPTPAPVALGEPGEGYPLPWAVQTWLPGTVAADADADAGGPTGLARDLAAFVRAVRAVDTRGRTFSGTGRGGDLRGHDEWVATCLRHSDGLVDVAAVRDLWTRLRDLPRYTPDVMTHGDLTPGNVLVAGGRLAGVLDVGGFGPADPALDLIGAWHLLDDGPRAVLRAELRCDDVEWARGAAWALEQSLGALWYYVDTNPPMHRMGRRTLARLLAARLP